MKLECVCRQTVIAVFVVFSATLIFTDTTYGAPATTDPPTEAVTNATTTNTTAITNGTTAMRNGTTAITNGTTVNVNTTTASPVTGNTTANVTTAPTEATNATTKATGVTTGKPGTVTPKPNTENKSGKFDAASFIGGMVLAAGVIVIALFGYKFYKSKQDKNYTQF
ncbi:uncharacterized protein [Amphiura filiformis]|uniref:uncharacterized protein isoform X2 n=1 Tax=Amphiura filiformis TaxID=82378 RepID=UPI003B21F4BE